MSIIQKKPNEAEGAESHDPSTPVPSNDGAHRPPPPASGLVTTAADDTPHTASTPPGALAGNPAPRTQGSSRIALAAEYAAAVDLEVGGKHVKRGSELLPPSGRWPHHARGKHVKQGSELLPASERPPRHLGGKHVEQGGELQVPGEQEPRHAASSGADELVGSSGTEEFASAVDRTTRTEMPSERKEYCMTDERYLANVEQLGDLAWILSLPDWPSARIFLSRALDDEELVAAARCHVAGRLGASFESVAVELRHV